MKERKLRYLLMLKRRRSFHRSMLVVFIKYLCGCTLKVWMTSYVKKFELDLPAADLTDWKEVVHAIEFPEVEVNVYMVGKYVESDRVITSH